MWFSSLAFCVSWEKVCRVSDHNVRCSRPSRRRGPRSETHLAQSSAAIQSVTSHCKVFDSEHTQLILKTSPFLQQEQRENTILLKAMTYTSGHSFKQSKEGLLLFFWCNSLNWPIQGYAAMPKYGHAQHNNKARELQVFSLWTQKPIIKLFLLSIFNLPRNNNDPLRSKSHVTINAVRRPKISACIRLQKDPSSDQLLRNRRYDMSFKYVAILNLPWEHVAIQLLTCLR